MITAVPTSPCINICSLDEQGYCRGCYRSREEIAGWIGMTPGRQREVIEATERRRRASQRTASA